MWLAQSKNSTTSVDYNPPEPRFANGELIDPFLPVKYGLFCVLVIILLYFIYKFVQRRSLLQLKIGVYELEFSRVHVILKLYPKPIFQITKTEIAPVNSILKISVSSKRKQINGGSLPTKLNKLFTGVGLSRFSSKNKIQLLDSLIQIPDFIVKNHEELRRNLKVFSTKLDPDFSELIFEPRLKGAWKYLINSKQGKLGIGIVTIFLTITLLSGLFTILYPLTSLTAKQELWTPFFLRNPNFITDKVSQPPTLSLNFETTYIFGTDDQGRDYFSRIFFGSFYSLSIAIFYSALFSLLGLIIGTTSGYIGGKVDEVIIKVEEFLLVLPGLPVLIFISALINPFFVRLNIEGIYYVLVFTTFALKSWPTPAKYVRAEVLALKESEAISALRSLGASHTRIIMKHIIPNSLSIIIIVFAFGIPSGIISIALLAYLGFGNEAGLFWGQDLAAALKNTNFLISGNIWWGVTFITLTIFLVTIGFNLIADKLQDVLNTKFELV